MGTGDWFNRLDFSYTTNNFGVGLPPAAKNEAAWPIKQPLLANHALKPSSNLIKVKLRPCLAQLNVETSWCGHCGASGRQSVLSMVSMM